LLLGQVATGLAGSDPLGHRHQRGGQPTGLFGGLLQQMKGEPLGRFPPDSGQAGQLGHQLLDGAHESEGGRKRQRRHLPHFGLQQIGGAPLGLGHGGQHQIAQKLGIVLREYAGIDVDCPDGSAAIGYDPHQPCSGRGFNGAAREFSLQFLQTALHLLSQLEELLEICHAVLVSRYVWPK
jgi:hypothetical protein